MQFHERLKEARVNTGLSQIEVSEYFMSKGRAVKSYSISDWEGGRGKPSIDDFGMLCELYMIADVPRLLTGKSLRIKTGGLLDGLNDKGQSHARNYIELLKADAMFTAEETEKKARIYRLYDLPVSAGSGEYLDSDDYTEITADDLVPDETDFAVRVSGDSMEPKFHDGQILFIKEQQVLEDGEIGIFALNNDSYVKRLEKNTLVSLNPKYQPIVINDWDDIRTYGKVIGTN